MIEVAEALEALRRVVARHGAVVYAERDPAAGEVCRYINPTTRQPSCLIGTLLVEEFGVDPEWFLDSSDENYDRNTEHTVAADEIRLEFGITPEAADVLLVAQNAQDAGDDWQMALAKAEAHYRAVKLGSHYA